MDPSISPRIASNTQLHLTVSLTLTPQIANREVDKRGGSTRRDANQEHFNAFCNGQAKAYKKYFGNIGPEQLHLQILATLPDFQRRGHATTLCRWGMDVIRRESLKDISVMASPMGYHLYARLGFDHVATVIIQVPGEEEKLTLQAMKYDSVMDGILANL